MYSLIDFAGLEGLEIYRYVVPTESRLESNVFSVICWAPGAEIYRYVLPTESRLQSNVFSAILLVLEGLEIYRCVLPTESRLQHNVFFVILLASRGWRSIDMFYKPNQDCKLMYSLRFCWPRGAGDL